MKKIRILEVNKLYYPHIGGIERVIQDISENLRDRADIRVLVCRDGKGKTDIDTVNKVRVVRAGSLGAVSSVPISFPFFPIFKEMSKKADIVHIHMPFPLADAAYLLSGFKGKLVLSWHCDIVRQKKMMLFYKPVMNALLKRADRILVATEGHIKGSAYIKPYKDKCVIIPYGIDCNSFHKAEKKPLLSKLLVNPSAKKILFIGRLVYYKGVDILLEAFAKTKGCELFIAGTGVLGQPMRERAKVLGIDKTVHFLGSPNDDDLKAALWDCDMFVLPSVANSEAFGIVQMEAMACGKPVINTNLPTGVPYVSLDGRNGFTVEPCDIDGLAKAIQKLADDDALRLKFGRNAEEDAKERFDMANVMEKVYEVFTLLAEEK